jgi:hypothetical protein
LFYTFQLISVGVRIRFSMGPVWLQPQRREPWRTEERRLWLFGVSGATAGASVVLPLNMLIVPSAGTAVVTGATMPPIGYSPRDPAANAGDAHDGKQRGYNILHDVLDFSPVRATFC